MQLPKHSYEEIREVVIDILTKQVHVTYEPDQWGNLTTGVAEVFGNREQPAGRRQEYLYDKHRLHQDDAELVRDVFWDLFRQGAITLGLNDSNPAWPFFRLSHFGKKILGNQNPYRFHDVDSFISLVKREVPDISPEAIIYLQEAVSTFYADCSLASCVMLGVAAESEFLRLLDIATASTNFGSVFAGTKKETFIRTKIRKFREALKPILSSLNPREHFEDVETNLDLIQSVLRVARNDAGHPTGSKMPEREQVYVFLQLFVPFARQLMRLRTALS
jgi:hypothetical protein